MQDYKALQHAVHRAPHITTSSRGQVPQQQGAYVLWRKGKPRTCLKVGIAGPRDRRRAKSPKGMRGRIGDHFKSDPSTSVLARHLAADVKSKWAKRFDLSDKAGRRLFLATECYFQVLPLPQLTLKELRQFERFIEATLRRRYAGRVGKKASG